MPIILKYCGVVRPGVPCRSSVGGDDLGLRVMGEEIVEWLVVFLGSGVLDKCYLCLPPKEIDEYQDRLVIHDRTPVVTAQVFHRSGGRCGGLQRVFVVWWCGDLAL